MKHDHDDYRDYDESGYGRALGIAIGWATVVILAAIVALIVLVGCSPKTIHVPVESVRTEYRDREVLRQSVDTVSNTRVIFVKGDTVVDIRREERLRRVEIHDTCFIERNDTIRIPYPVERALSRWEQIKVDFGGCALAVCIVAIVGIAIWIARRFI